jgi:hypothetical protein
MSSLLVSFRGQDNHVFNAQSMSSEYEIILMLSTNISIHFASMSAFCPESSGTISWAAICYLTGPLKDIVTLKTTALGLLQDVPLSVR